MYGMERTVCALIMYQNKNASSTATSFSRQLRVSMFLNRTPKFMPVLLVRYLWDITLAIP